MSVIIELQNVTMKYNLAQEKIDSMKEYFVKLIKGQLLFQEFTALDDVSLTISSGDIFGIVGLNGSGKSTMLKIISGILTPTKGKVRVQGSISPLIELGAGFDPDLTARENIYLNGLILGHSKALMSSKFDEIVDFAELHQFIDVPVKNFSSGMYARLGFSVATIIKPDILIVDEILSVGDFRFQEKCEKRIRQLMAGGTTVIIVSHALKQVRDLCNHVVWLEKGRIKMSGNAKDVCDKYETQDA